MKKLNTLFLITVIFSAAFASEREQSNSSQNNQEHQPQAASAQESGQSARPDLPVLHIRRNTPGSLRMHPFRGLGAPRLGTSTAPLQRISPSNQQAGPAGRPSTDFTELNVAAQAPDDTQSLPRRDSQKRQLGAGNTQDQEYVDKIFDAALRASVSIRRRIKDIRSRDNNMPHIVVATLESSSLSALPIHIPDRNNRGSGYHGLTEQEKDVIRHMAQLEEPTQSAKRVDRKERLNEKHDNE